MGGAAIVTEAFVYGCTVVGHDTAQGKYCRSLDLFGLSSSQTSSKSDTTFGRYVSIIIGQECIDTISARLGGCTDTSVHV